jgi:hypothetical protein
MSTWVSFRVMNNNTPTESAIVLGVVFVVYRDLITCDVSKRKRSQNMSLEHLNNGSVRTA